MLAENEELAKNKFDFRVLRALHVLLMRIRVPIHLRSLGLLVCFLFMLTCLDQGIVEEWQDGQKGEWRGDVVR